MSAQVYTTRSQGKALALFKGLTDLNQNAVLTSAYNAKQVVGYVLYYECDPATFKMVRAAVSDQYPSSNPQVADMPETIEIPDSLPEDFA